MHFSTDWLTDWLAYFTYFTLIYLLTYCLLYFTLLTYLFTYFLTYLLTYLLMPSEKHNSRTAWARDLISSLINVASSQDVPFHQPQLLQLQCLHHGATFEPFCAPIIV